MAARKDNKGRALRKGEIYRESDNRYAYGYTDSYGNRKFIYYNLLNEKKIQINTLGLIYWL